MTREDVIRLARDAGFTEWKYATWDDLINFSGMVADEERESCARVCVLLAGEVQRRFGIGAELIAARRERDGLVAAIRQTLDENAHLADGDVCTLKRLKEALLAVGVDWAREHGTGGGQTLDDIVRFGKAATTAEREVCSRCVMKSP